MYSGFLQCRRELLNKSFIDCLNVFLVDRFTINQVKHDHNYLHL